MNDSDIENVVNNAAAAYQTGKYREAAEGFRQAAFQLHAAGDALRAAEMSNNLSVTLLMTGEASFARDAVLGTDAVFAAAGDIRRQAMALGNLAAAEDSLGDKTGALAHYQQSANLLQQCHEPDLRALVLKKISVFQMQTGDQLSALASMQAALENQTRLAPHEGILKRLLRFIFRKSA